MACGVDGSFVGAVDGRGAKKGIMIYTEKMSSIATKVSLGCPDSGRAALTAGDVGAAARVPARVLQGVGPARQHHTAFLGPEACYHEPGGESRAAQEVVSRINGLE